MRAANPVAGATRGARRRVALGLLLAAALAVAGCFGQGRHEVKRYPLLAAEESLAATVPGPFGKIRLGNFRVDPVFERPSMVFRQPDGRWERDLYHEFSLNPGALMRLITRDHLRSSGLFEAVLSTTSFEGTDWLLQARVRGLYGDRRSQPAGAVLHMEYALLDADSPDLRVVFRKAYKKREDAGDGSADATAEALGRSLRLVLDELSEDLEQTLAELKPATAAQGEGAGLP